MTYAFLPIKQELPLVVFGSVDVVFNHLAMVIQHSLIYPVERL